MHTYFIGNTKYSNNINNNVTYMSQSSLCIVIISLFLSFILFSSSLYCAALISAYILAMI